MEDIPQLNIHQLKEFLTRRTPHILGEDPQYASLAIDSNIGKSLQKVLEPARGEKFTFEALMNRPEIEEAVNKGHLIDLGIDGKARILGPNIGSEMEAMAILSAARENLFSQLRRPDISIDPDGIADFWASPGSNLKDLEGRKIAATFGAEKEKRIIENVQNTMAIDVKQFVSPALGGHMASNQPDVWIRNILHKFRQSYPFEMHIVLDVSFMTPKDVQDLRELMVKVLTKEELARIHEVVLPGKYKKLLKNVPEYKDPDRVTKSYFFTPPNSSPNLTYTSLLLDVFSKISGDTDHLPFSPRTTTVEPPKRNIPFSSPRLKLLFLPEKAG